MPIVHRVMFGDCETKHFASHQPELMWLELTRSWLDFHKTRNIFPSCYSKKKEIIYGSFIYRIEESESVIEMIDSICFVKIEQESESESWDPLIFGNGEWEIDSMGSVGINFSFPRVPILPPLTFKFF